MTEADVATLNSRELGNLVWGLAQLNMREERLLEAVAKRAAELTPGMKMKQATYDLPLIICGMRRLQFDHDDFMKVATDRLVKKRTIKLMNNWGVCALLWSWPSPKEKKGGPASQVMRLLE